ncbi:MAG: hypothetical protein GC151_10035 [Betaproteobacteria bacterium]|nr:hypothetical protein [Betaproteobacteria bacterium]
MNVAAWVLTGIIAGLIANRLLNEGSKHGRTIYIVLGVFGALAGVQLLSPARDPNMVDRETFNMLLLMYSAIGAGVLLFVGNFVREKFFP